MNSSLRRFEPSAVVGDSLHRFHDYRGLKYTFFFEGGGGGGPYYNYSIIYPKTPILFKKGSLHYFIPSPILVSLTRWLPVPRLLSVGAPLPFGRWVVFG